MPASDCAVLPVWKHGKAGKRSEGTVHKLVLLYLSTHVYTFIRLYETELAGIMPAKLDIYFYHFNYKVSYRKNTRPD